MAGFRVAQHGAWRNAPPRTTPRAAGPPNPSPAAHPDVAALQREVSNLGPIAYPARAYDTLLGPLHGRGGVYWALRFFLVVVTVMLLIGGVQGEALVEHEVGPFEAISRSGTITDHLSTNAPHRYLLDVDTGRPDRVVAVFGTDTGTIRVPTLDPLGSAAYGLQMRLVRHDPYVQPLLSIRTPDSEAITRLMPLSDDGVTLRFDTVRLQADGEFQLLLQSGRGAGTVDLYVSVAEAAIRPVEQLRPDWLPLVGGIAMGTVLVGAYTPGAATLAEIRDVRKPTYRMAEDRMMPTHPRRLVRGDGVRPMHGPVVPTHVSAGWVRRE